jgi:hypothetical protein
MAAGIKKTIEECEKEALLIGVRFISTTYLDARSDHDYECLTCLFIFPATPSNIKKKAGCPKCGHKRIGEASRTDIEIVMEEIARRGYTYNYHEFRKNKKGRSSLWINATCPRKHEPRDRSWNKFYNYGRGCATCAVEDRTIYKNDISRRIAKSLRIRFKLGLRAALKQKKCSAVLDIGCAWDEFIIYIEKLFQPGMNWGNWGRGPGKWNMDHIKPLALFDLENEEEQKKACHYTNLQPLWAFDNLSKGAKWNP